MDFLGNILSGQDLVNKDYVDKAIPVVPTKLSELTDDILSGKYLLLSGGSINGNLSVNNGNIVSNYASGGVILKNGASFYFNDSTGTNRKVLRLTSNVLQLGSTALETSITSGGTIALSANTSVNGVLSVATDITTPLINGGTPIHSNNYSSYALPLSGGTVTGTIEFTASTPALKFYRDYGNVPYIHFGASPTSGYGEVGADKNGNLVFWSLVSGNSAYNAWNTVLHAKNIGEYALKKVANVSSLDAINAGEFFYSGYRPTSIPEGNYAGGVTLQTFLDAANDYRAQLAFSTEAKCFVRKYINGTWGYWKTIAFTDSNVASATKLETARKLWGNNFDGTADVAAQLTFNANDAALSAWKKDGSSTSIFLQVNPDRHLLIGQGTARENGGLYLYGNDIRMCYGNAGSSSNTAMLINSSGNVTIGSSDTAGTSYKLRVDGTSRFTDRVSVTSLRIIPVNGSYSADFAIEGSSLTLNRELKFTNVTASDICSGIAAAFKTSLAQTENLIARNIILGASSGSASNLALSFQKYTSVSNTAPNGLTTLMTLTTDGNLGIGTTSPAYKLDVVGKARVSDELIVTYPTGFRWAYGDYGVLFRNDANKFYVLLTDAGGALSGSWNALRPFAISLTTGDVTMGHNLDVKGTIKSSSLICGTTRLRVNSPTNGGVFGYMDAQLFGTTTNVSSVHIGSCYGGNSTLDDTTEYPSGVSLTAISIYRGRVGIGKRWSDTELRALHDANCSLGVWNNAHIMGNLAVSSIYSDNGQSGATGVFLRNEGGIEITHASTPYIDFHYSAGTSDFSHRLIARTATVFAYSGNYFCPWGSESLGASSYRWKAVYAKAGSFSNDVEINGALTVGGTSTFNGDVRINGNLVVTGDTASGGAGQETTLTSQLLVINQSLPESTSISQSSLDAIGLTSDVIDDLIDGKYHHVLEVAGSNKSLYTISGYKSTGTREFILQYGSAEADTAWWYVFRQYNGGNWSVTFDEI